jgi:hypothetical protein
MKESTRNIRFYAAAALNLGLAAYVTAFSRQTHDLYDLPTFIDLTEWPATLLFLAAAWFAWSASPRAVTLLVVAGLFAFFAAHARFLFSVPLGFVLVTLGTLAVLALVPPRSH